MPYIKKQVREGYYEIIDEMVDAISVEMEECGNCNDIPVDVGELNFIISKFVWDLFEKNKRYKTANDFIGALECVKLEFYRRKVAPYEDEKIKENGDL